MLVRIPTTFLAVALVFATALALEARAASTSLGASNDTYIRDGRSNDDSGPSEALDSRTGSGFAFVSYIQFDLSALTIDSIDSATLRVWKVTSPSGKNDTITTGRFATYGLNDDPNNTLQYWDESADFDPNDATDGLDFRNVGAEWTDDDADNGIDRSLLTSLDPEDGGVSTTEFVDNSTGEATVTGADLVSFLETRYAAGGLVTFLLPMENTPDKGFGFASKENSTASLRPQLDLQYTVPEPTTGVLFLAASAIALLGRRREA